MSYISPIKIGYAAEPEEGWTDKIGRYIAGEVDNLVLESCVKVGCHVDKDELEKALRYDRGQYDRGYADGKRDAAAAIEALQAQLPKLGEWLPYEFNTNGTWHKCSVCGVAYQYKDAPNSGWWINHNYCPNCGAKMTEVQDGK